MGCFPSAQCFCAWLQKLVDALNRVSVESATYADRGVALRVLVELLARLKHEDEDAEILGAAASSAPTERRDRLTSIFVKLLLHLQQKEKKHEVSPPYHRDTMDVTGLASALAAFYSCGEGPLGFIKAGSKEEARLRAVKGLLADLVAHGREPCLRKAWSDVGLPEEHPVHSVLRDCAADVGVSSTSTSTTTSSAPPPATAATAGAPSASAPSVAPPGIDLAALVKRVSMIGGPTGDRDAALSELAAFSSTHPEIVISAELRKFNVSESLITYIDGQLKARASSSSSSSTVSSIHAEVKENALGGGSRGGCEASDALPATALNVEDRLAQLRSRLGSTATLKGGP